MALSGYDAARHFAGNSSWTGILAGMAAMQRSRSETALELFAAAALLDPDQYLAFEGVAASAYGLGHLELAMAAAERARRLRPDSLPAWSAAVLSAAARGDSTQVDALLSQFPTQAPASERNRILMRSKALLRTAALDQATVVAAGDAGAPPTDDSVMVETSTSNQLNVDVTLILADDRITSKFGVNLLEGLQGIFGMSRISTSINESGVPYAKATTITREIHIPDITYNLNIFNRGNRFYDVIARPSLTAFLGQQSAFFVGEQINIQVSGIQSAQLEKIDVGVALKVTPEEIRSDGARFKVEADRSYFSDQGLGSFTQGIAIFKQSVSATADVHFGETLILSGLSESVNDGQDSRTPVLGDIPGPNILFRRENRIKSTRSVLVLVTPSSPAGFPRTRVVAPAVQRLIEMWDTVIEPQHGLPILIERIRRHPKFTRAAAADTGVRSLRDPQVLIPFLDTIADSNTKRSEIMSDAFLHRRIGDSP